MILVENKECQHGQIEFCGDQMVDMQLNCLHTIVKTVKTSDHRAVRAIFNIPTIVNTDITGEVHKERRNTKFGRHDSQVCIVM